MNRTSQGIMNIIRGATPKVFHTERTIFYPTGGGQHIVPGTTKLMHAILKVKIKVKLTDRTSERNTSRIRESQV